MTQELTDRQKAFCNEYIIDWNGTRAAIAAGYAKPSARQLAYDTLSKNYIKEYISKKIHARIEKAELNEAFIMRELYEAWQADIMDIIDLKNGGYKPVEEWAPIFRKMVTSIKVKEVFEGVGLDKEKVGEVTEVVFGQKLKYLELLGKCASVGAFRETLDINVTHKDVSSKLSAARQRQQQSVESEN